MRTLILALTVLLFAAPVWADVEITLTNLGGGEIAIGYDATSEAPGLVRAFALDIQATDGNIVDINDYAIGDDNNGFGIFPGAFAAAPIAVNPTTGEVDNWAVAGYSPVAPGGDPDALGDIPGPGITIELGSLYDTAAPGETGTLCVITVDENVSKVCVTGNAIRGNVVLETAAEATMTPAEVCLVIGTECYPVEGGARYDRWVSLGKPDCWCEAGEGDINGSPSRGMQCRADADNVAQFAFYEVFTDDLAILAADWKGLCASPMVNVCADFDHQCQFNFYSVFTDDLAILAASWKATVGTLATDCPDSLWAK